MCLNLFLRQLINLTIDLIINQSVFRVGIKIIPKLAQSLALNLDQLNIHWPPNVQQHPKKKRFFFAKGKKS